ncbi:MAG: hypothetical protein CM15mV42_0120 [uncultured marine virus]|nr:MAG: hypothetical protein CM15mV42_0120 [uncultured marine virus]
MKVIPVGRKILIKPLEAEKFFKGTTILIPESQQKREAKGIVAGVGEAVGQIKDGDLVQYSDNAALVPMSHNGEEHFLINEGDVFAVLVDA